jgi:DNA-directed RNA polymerase specialized sigma24 family protein
LISRRSSTWIGSVPADDAGASGIRTGPINLPREGGAVAFTTTQWSVVLEAQGRSPAAQEALEKLCRTYWPPVYGFLRRQGFRLEAEDLTQGFFALLLERRDLDAVRREKGRLRSYLLTSLKHYLASERRRAMAIKRGKGQRPLSLEELGATERIEMEPADVLSADRLYERRWASTLMEQVLRRLKDEYCTAGNAALFDRQKPWWLLGDLGPTNGHALCAQDSRGNVIWPGGTQTPRVQFCDAPLSFAAVKGFKGAFQTQISDHASISQDPVQ